MWTQERLAVGTAGLRRRSSVPRIKCFTVSSREEDDAGRVSLYFVPVRATARWELSWFSLFGSLSCICALVSCSDAAEAIRIGEAEEAVPAAHRRIGVLEVLSTQKQKQPVGLVSHYRLLHQNLFFVDWACFCWCRSR
jgi:hypothetical protein